MSHFTDLMRELKVAVVTENYRALQRSMKAYRDTHKQKVNCKLNGKKVILLEEAKRILSIWKKNKYSDGTSPKNAPVHSFEKMYQDFANEFLMLWQRNGESAAKVAYRELCQANHPDVAGDETLEKMQAITRAWSATQNAMSRRVA